MADRVNRKYLLLGSDLLRGVIVLAIPLVGRGELLVPTVLLVAFLTGIIDAFDGSARSALIPRLVPERDLQSANPLNQLTFSLSQVLFAAGGAVVALVGYSALSTSTQVLFFYLHWLFSLSPRIAGDQIVNETTHQLMWMITKQKFKLKSKRCRVMFVRF